jgi:hypothetical protein
MGRPYENTGKCAQAPIIPPRCGNAIAMDEPGQPELYFAVLVGALFPLLHLCTGWITLRLGWRRGHLRDGLLHGMLLGPLGLLTALLLKRHRRATLALRYEYAQSTADPYHAWFFCACALLYLGIGLGYGLLAYRHLLPLAVLPQGYTLAAVLALALGLGAFYRAKPRSAWIPPLGDYAEYPEDPEFTARLRFNHRQYILKQTARDASNISVLISLLLAPALLVFLAVIGGEPELQHWWVYALLAAIAVAYIAAQIYLYRRQARAEAGLRQFYVDYAADDPRRLPCISPELRARAMQISAQFQETHARLRLCELLFNACLLGAAGSVLGGIALVAYLISPWRFAGLAGCMLIALGLAKLSNYFQAPLADLRAKLAAVKQEDQVLLQEVRPIIASYRQEQRAVNLAFRYEELPDTLLSRRIRIYEHPPEEDDAEADDDKNAELALDEEPAPTGEAVPAAASEATPPLESIEPQVQVEPQPASAPMAPGKKRAALWQSIAICLGAVLLCLMAAWWFPSLPDMPPTTRGTWLFLAAVCLAAGVHVMLQLRALPKPRDAPDQLVSGPALQTGESVVSQPPAAELAPDPQYAPAPSKPEVQEAQQPVNVIGLQQKLERKAQAVSRRLSGRGLMLALLLYPTLVVILATGMAYMSEGVAPTHNELAGLAVWLLLVLPTIDRIWRGNIPLYWELVQLRADVQPTPQWYMAVETEGYWQAWERSARNKLRLLWLACGLLYGTLVLGWGWTAGVLSGPAPVPWEQWVLLALGLAGSAGYLGYAYRKARAEQLSWRARWIKRVKDVQHEQYREAMALRQRTEVLEEHEGFELHYSPGQLDDATIRQWVERDSQAAFGRDPVEHWLDRWRSLAFAGAWCLWATLPVLVNLPHLSAVLDIVRTVNSILLALGLSLWLGRQWRLRALRK